MGLDQYFHRFRSLKEEDVNRLKGKVSYETYQELSNKLSFIDADEVNESNDLQITEYYGVLTDVELLIIDYEAAFSEKYPDVKYEDCVCVGAHYGPQGSGRTYRNKVTDERYSVELSTEEERRFEKKQYFPMYVLDCTTVAYWRKAYFLENWMDKQFGGIDNLTNYKLSPELLDELDTDCHEAMGSPEDFERLFNTNLYPDEDFEGIKEYLRETIDQISSAYEAVDWKAGDALTYYEWF